MDLHHPSPYIFDKHKITIPHYMSIVIPPDLRNGIRLAREAAGTAFHALKQLERHHHERYYRLCPSHDDIDRFHNHRTSVNRLLGWKVKSNPDPPLSLCAKIPICVVNFHINEDAYRVYSARYERVRVGYLAGPYTEWNKVKKRLDELFDRCEMAELDKKLCRDWWEGFQREMQVWERRVHNLALPKWSEIVRELAEMIEERVDLENDWENCF